LKAYNEDKHSDLDRLKHAPRVLGRRLVFTVGAAVPYRVALVDVAVVVAAGRHDRVGALAGFAVDAGPRRAVGAVADGAELRGPPLPVDEVTSAMGVSELTPGEVAAAVAGGLRRARGRDETAGSDRGRRRRLKG